MPRKKELNVEEHPVWSPTRLDIADDCLKAYWFQYVLKLNHSIPPNVARGKLFHKLIENFWKINEKSGILVRGYSSYGSFINSAIRDWKFQYAKTSETDGQKIDWDFNGQQWSKGFLGEIADTAGRIYSRYIIEEPRLASEFEIKGECEGFKIMAKIDELRKDLVIRDHKSGQRKHGEFYLKNNIQMTHYLLCLFGALQNPISSLEIKKIYPEFIGISLDDFLETARIEIHDLSTKTVYNKEEKIKEPVSLTPIYEAMRVEQDFYDLIATMDSKEKSLKERDFHPTKGKKCDFCFYRRECPNYDPAKFHENEFEDRYPLFASSGLTMEEFSDSNNPKVKKERKQKIIRFKYN